MASTVTPYEDMDPSPRVDVFIDDSDLDGDTVTITVHQISVAGDIEVRNMVGVASAGGFAGTDYEPPFGVAITYRVAQYDAGGTELGFVLELTTQVDVETNVVVLSDPLAPGSAVKARAEAGFAAQMTRRRPTRVYRAGLRTVALMGLQGLLEDLPLRCWTDNADDRDMFVEVTAQTQILVRTMPNFPFPRILFAVVPDVVQVPFDYHQGGVTDVWDITGTEVSRPEIDIIVPVINYQLFADYVATVGDGTYGFAATVWSTYLDALLNPPSD
jgi:hypothetical protein